MTGATKVKTGNKLNCTIPNVAYKIIFCTPFKGGEGDEERGVIAPGSSGTQSWELNPRQKNLNLQETRCFRVQASDSFVRQH